MDFQSRKVLKPKKEVIGDVNKQFSKFLIDQNTLVEEKPSDGKLRINGDDLIQEPSLLRLRQIEELCYWLNQQTSFRGEGHTASSALPYSPSRIPTSQIKVIKPSPSIASTCNSEYINFQTVHPLKADLNALLKKFLAAKSNMVQSEKSMFTFAEQAQILVDKITKETEEEIPVDNELTELLNFAGTEEIDLDLAMYKDILHEIDGTWRNVIYDNAGIKKEKPGDKKNTLPVPILKSLASAQETVNQMHRILLTKLTKIVADISGKTQTVENKLAACEQLLQEKEDHLNTLKTIDIEAKTSQLVKTCETLTEELAKKNQVIEELNKDLDEVEALNREIQEKLDRQETEHHLACEKTKEVQKNYEDIHEKLVYIQMREQNLRKWTTESIPVQIQEILSQLKGKISAQERASIDALGLIIQDLELKIDGYKETDEKIKRQEDDLHGWEEELRTREVIFSEQNKLLSVRNQLLSIVEKRADLREEVAKGTSDLLGAKSHEIKEILSILKKRDTPSSIKGKKYAERRS